MKDNRHVKGGAWPSVKARARNTLMSIAFLMIKMAGRPVLSRKIKGEPNSLGKYVEKFKLFWKNYLYQSFLATLAVLVVLLFLSIEQAVIIASIGASAFIVFAMPKNVTAKPRNVIGGHIVGLLSGSLCTLLPQPSFLYSISAYSLAVGISIFIMVVIDTEHPPAAGTALGVAMKGFSLHVAIAVITSAVILSSIHYILKSSLKDLT